MPRSPSAQIILAVLGVGFILGYIVACSNTQPTKPSNADEEKQVADIESGAPSDPASLPSASPVKALGAREVYYPGSEDLAPDEMRIVACGTGMPNARPKQAAACWLVELGNGDKFLFDIGTGSAERISALQIPYNYLNKVFIGHLHSDHFGDLGRSLLWRHRCQSSRAIGSLGSQFHRAEIRNQGSAGCHGKNVGLGHRHANGQHRYARSVI